MCKMFHVKHFVCDRIGQDVARIRNEMRVCYKINVVTMLKGNVLDISLNYMQLMLVLMKQCNMLH